MKSENSNDANYQKTINDIGAVIKNADAILVTTGAGMGVASGFGTFRGKHAGVWPPLKSKNIDFTDISSPEWFFKKEDAVSQDSVNFAYAFWQFRYNAYRYNEPHEGYACINNWIKCKTFGGFSFTSNIDNHWIRSGLSPNKVYECHGSIGYMQCAGISRSTRNKSCKSDIWEAVDNDYKMDIDEKTDCVTSSIPKCIHCKNISRPNVYMFNDYNWNEKRSNEQKERYDNWINTIISTKATIVILEIGAGTVIPTVRNESENVTDSLQKEGCSVTLVRINPDNSDIPVHLGNHHISSNVENSLKLLKDVNDYIMT